MGLLSWWKGKKAEPAKPSSTTTGGEVPGLNGAEEVHRPADVTVFEFGSAAASGEKVTMAGYCPVSDDIEPCRWQIVPATGSDAPQFRVVF